MGNFISKLSKWQKFMIVFSVVYEIYIFIQYSTYIPSFEGTYFDCEMEEFFKYSLPIILYWTLFWICGDKWSDFIKTKSVDSTDITTMLKKITGSLLSIVAKVILVVILFYLVVGSIGVSVENFIENSRKEHLIQISERWKQMTPEAMEDLIKKGTSTKERDETGNTLLMYAVKYSQDPRIIDILIKHGADVNARNQEGMTALMTAVTWCENPEIIRALIRHGADVNARHPDSDTVLIGASGFNRNPKIIEILLNNGANVKLRNKNGTNALMRAAMFNENPDIIDVLIKHGANIKEKDGYGYTVLMLAAGKSKNQEVIKRLIKYGADAKANLNGKTVLDFARLNSKIYKTDVYWYLNDLMYKQ